MVTILRFPICTIAILMLGVCGCRSVSKNPSGGVNRIPFGMTGMPSARLSGKPQHDYDDDPENQSLPSQAPSVLPAPGVSEAEDTPPIPSAKKSRWNLVPSGLKFSSNTKFTDVRQTGVKSDRNAAKTSPQISPTTNDEDVLTEETVVSRYSGASSRSAISQPSNDSSGISQSPVYRSAAANRGTRSGIRNFSTDTGRGLRSRAVPTLDATARPLSNPNSTEPSGSLWDEDTPVLLPPGA